MEKAGGLFLLGFASIAFPCVLPLVPGYLSAVSAVEAQRLGDPGVGRRVALASLPFIAGKASAGASPWPAFRSSRALRSCSWRWAPPRI